MREAKYRKIEEITLQGYASSKAMILCFIAAGIGQLLLRYYTIEETVIT